MGADALFRAYFGLGPDHPVPLSVAHGVDFGHCFYPLDVKTAEPIHWSCNEEMHERAKPYKPSLLLPHPWIMATEEYELSGGTGTLFIGPPPGPANDERLYRLIEKSLHSECAILIKARGAYQGSIDFWRERGLTPVSAGAGDDHFYARLGQLFARYRRIVGATFSSALLFAASVGREVELVPGFVHETLEPLDYESEVNWASPRAQSIVATFLAGDQAEVRRVAKHVLGGDLAIDRSAKLEELYALIAELDSPFWMNPEVRFPPAWVRRKLALLLRKPGLLNAGAHAYAHRLRRARLAVMRVNEVDVWLNGKSPSNFRLDPVLAGRAGALAGQAAEGYDR